MAALTPAGALGGGALVLSLCLTACSGGSGKEDSTAAPGYGDAVLALTSQSDDGFLETSQMHGSVILVAADGTFRAIETKGINNGGVGLHDGALHVSDIDHEYRISASDNERTERGVKKYAQEGALSTPYGHLTVFNDGVGEDDEYHSGVILDDGVGDTVEGDIEGELWYVQTCGEDVVVMVSSWQRPGAELRLMRMTVDDGSLDLQKSADVDLPKGGPDQAVLLCAGDRPVVLQDRGPGKVDYLAVFDGDGPPSWAELEVGGHPDWGVFGCGADADSLILMDTHRRQATKVKIDGAQVSHFLDLPQPDAASGERVEFVCGYQDGVFRIRASDGSYDDPTYYWYDVAGNLLRELTVKGLGTFLRENGESVSGDVTLDTEALLASSARD